MKWIRSFIVSVSMYTRVRIISKFDKVPDMRAVIFNLSIIGLFIGLLWFLLYKALMIINIQPVMSAVILSVFPHWMSAFLHLEGYIDAGKKILSDRRQMVGTPNVIGNIYAIVYFIFYFATTYLFIVDNVNPLYLIVLPVLSRELALMGIYLMPALSITKTEDYGKSEHKQYTIILMIMFLSTAIIAVLISMVYGILMVMCMLIAFFWSYRRANDSCGVSGETLNYTLCITEIVGLFSITFINLSLFK